MGDNGSPRIPCIHIFICISILTITWQLNWYFILIFKLLRYCKITFDNRLLMTLVYFRWYSAGNRSSVWHLFVVWYFVFVMVFAMWRISYLACVWQLCPISIPCHSCGIQVSARGQLDESFIDLPLQNKFPVVWEFLGIPSYSKTCKLCFIQDLGISGNIWE